MSLSNWDYEQLARNPTATIPAQQDNHYIYAYKLSNNTVDIMNTVFFAADLANIHKKARPCKTAYYGLSGQ
ncbi:hypothetical protein F443_05155, partial [Phytophthora nicotianae P1569]